MLVDTGATHSYIGKQFFKQIKELDYEVKKPNNDKLIVANGQQLQIIGQVLSPIICNCWPFATIKIGRASCRERL